MFNKIATALVLVVVAHAVPATAAGSATDPATENAANNKAIADAGKAAADAHAETTLLPGQAAALQAQTALLYAQAELALSQSDLNEANAALVRASLDALYQRMRMADYEFNRITRADYVMERDIAEVEENENLVRPLVLGMASWKTWIGLERLMLNTGDGAVIEQVMFEIPVTAFPATEFRANDGGPAPAFPGGNLGQLYTFAQDNDLSFRKFGPAHQAIMKILAMINKAAELRINELRDVDQAIRLTVAKITNT